MRLNELRDNPGATKTKKRRGRGAGSGLGTMGGRGIKGQKSRRGVALDGFEGGQMPIHRRLPKRGFRNAFARKFTVTNLGKLQAWIDAGRLDASAVIDAAALLESGLIRRERDGVRLLAKGELTSQGLQIEVAGASKTAIAAVEAAGGKLTIKAPVTEPAEGANEAGAKAEAGPEE